MTKRRHFALLIVVIAALLLGNRVVNTGSTSPLPNRSEFTSWWSLDEGSDFAAGAADATGTNNLALAGTVTSVSGIVSGGAQGFNGNGTNSKLSIADGSATGLEPGSGAFSFGGWVRFTGDTGTTSSGMAFGKYNTSGNQRSYSFQQNADATTFRFLTSSDGAGSTGITTSSFGSDVWRFVVCTYDPSTRMEVWINGASDVNTTTSVPASVFNSTASFTVSGGANAATNFNGACDSVFFIPRLLTSTEIAAMYNSGAGVAWADLPP